MNAQEYLNACDRISKLKEFENVRFLNEFTTQLVATAFLLASDPVDYMDEFWRAVNRKEKAMTR